MSNYDHDPSNPLYPFVEAGSGWTIKDSNGNLVGSGSITPGSQLLFRTICMSSSTKNVVFLAEKIVFYIRQFNAMRDKVELVGLDDALRSINFKFLRLGDAKIIKDRYQHGGDDIDCITSGKPIGSPIPDFFTKNGLYIKAFRMVIDTKYHSDAYGEHSLVELYQDEICSLESLLRRAYQDLCQS